MFIDNDIDIDTDIDTDHSRKISRVCDCYVY